MTPLIYLKQNDIKKDITSVVSSITWSGSNGDISRVLEIDVLYPIHDVYTPRTLPALGDTIQLVTEDSKELFRGKVFYNEQVSSQGTVKVTCYDDAIRLSKSKGTFNFKNATAEAITKRVCDEINLPVGSLAATNINQKKLVNGEGLYQVIKDVYEGAGLQNGKRYLPFSLNGKLNVIESGSTTIDYVLNDSINIISSSFSQKADSIINRVKVYDENDKYIDTVSDNDSINKFGIFQDVYTKEKGKQALAVAKNMLTGIENSIDVVAIGNVNCMTGYNVKVEDSTTGLSGIFEIESDTHTWSNGQYEVSLKLKFKG